MNQPVVSSMHTFYGGENAAGAREICFVHTDLWIDFPRHAARMGRFGGAVW